MNERINRSRVDGRSIRILKLRGFKNIRIALIISIVFLESNRECIFSLPPVQGRGLYMARFLKVHSPIKVKK